MSPSIWTRSFAAIAVSAAALSVASGAWAHHSFAMFDFTKNITLTGEIKQFQWTNPHSQIVVTVADGSGKTSDWQVEGGSPNGLGREGWKRNSLKAGDKAVVVIHPYKNGAPGGCLVSATVGGVLIGNPRPAA